MTQPIPPTARVGQLAAGDLVWHTQGGVEVPAVITAVHHDDSGSYYDVFAIPSGAWPVPLEDVRPIDGPRPAAGQRWRCLSRPDLVLTIRSVERGGLIAECETPKGSVTAVILHGRYELIGGAA